MFSYSWWLQYKKRKFPKGIRRKLDNYKRRLLQRTSERALTRLFAGLGIEPGAAICVHSMLSAFGYLTGGPESVIRAIQRAVPGCTIMMPTFPFDGTAVEYLRSGKVFDPGTTQSRSGLLTDIFRRMPGCRRSHHPTHPCAALGPLADELIVGSEMSPTPFGDDSTYGRFSSLKNAYVLLLHTNGTSLVHRFQELVDMPNLFLPGLSEVKGIDPHGKIATYRVKIHVPRLPLYVIMAGNQPAEREYVWMPDDSFLFPAKRRIDIMEKMLSRPAKEFLTRRQEDLVNLGIIRTSQLRNAEVAAIRVGPWQERICRDLSESIRVFKDDYAQERISTALAGKFLS